MAWAPWLPRWWRSWRRRVSLPISATNSATVDDGRPTLPSRRRRSAGRDGHPRRRRSTAKTPAVRPPPVRPRLSWRLLRRPIWHRSEDAARLWPLFTGHPTRRHQNAFDQFTRWFLLFQERRGGHKARLQKKNPRQAWGGAKFQPRPVDAGATFFFSSTQQERILSKRNNTKRSKME